MQDDRAANCETADGSQRKELSDFRAQMQEVGKHCGQSTQGPEHIEPDGRMHRIHLITVAESQLQQDGYQTDGRDNEYGQGTEEGSASGENYDQGEGAAEQARGDNRPAARLGCVGQRFILVEAS